MTLDDFLGLVEAELGLRVNPEDAARGFDELAGWDSVHLLALMGTVERTTGRGVSLARVLEASSLAEIYKLTVQE